MTLIGEMIIKSKRFKKYCPYILKKHKTEHLIKVLI